MDELSILREQVSLERRHMAVVRTACREALASTTEPAFFATARDYLVFVMHRFLAQDAAHVQRLRGAAAELDSAAQRALEELASALDGLQSALAALESTADPIAACRAFVSFVDVNLTPHRHVLAPLIGRHYSIEDWRAASFVDADSILEERRRFAAVREALPPGLSLDAMRPAAAAAAG